MSKKFLGIIMLNIFMAMFILVMFYIGPLRLNFFDLNINPIIFGISVSFLVFMIGSLIYIDKRFLNYMSIELKRVKNYKVKDRVLKDLTEASTSLVEAKKDNSRIRSWIQDGYNLVDGFLTKTNTVKELLANHGEKISDWDWINDATKEAENEILANVREILDTAIVFNNDNYTESNVISATEKIKESNKRIEQISIKYDEIIDLIQKVLEQKLHNKGNIVTDSLDLTIDSVKKVYGIDVKNEFAELLEKDEMEKK